MTRVFIHPHAGVLSAYGMGLADQVAMRQQSLEARLDLGVATIESELERLSLAAKRELVEQGLDEKRLRVVQKAPLKYEGTPTALPVPPLALPPHTLHSQPPSHKPLP